VEGELRKLLRDGEVAEKGSRLEGLRESGDGS
jgi:hypothetical protein